MGGQCANRISDGDSPSISDLLMACPHKIEPIRSNLRSALQFRHLLNDVVDTGTDRVRSNVKAVVRGLCCHIRGPYRLGRSSPGLSVPANKEEPGQNARDTCAYQRSNNGGSDGRNEWREIPREQRKLKEDAQTKSYSERYANSSKAVRHVGTKPESKAHRLGLTIQTRGYSLPVRTLRIHRAFHMLLLFCAKVAVYHMTLAITCNWYALAFVELRTAYIGQFR